MIKKLKIMSIYIITILLLLIQTSLISAADSKTFSDVSSDLPHYNAIEYCYENGIVSGIGDGRFSPDTATSRGMFVVMFLKMNGWDFQATNAENQFVDVDPASYYAPYITKAAESGIINGSDGKHMLPDNGVTRQDAAVILYSYFGSDSVYTDSAALTKYSDVSDISSYAKDALIWAVDSGFIEADGDLLEPKKILTRAETAQVMKNAAEYNMKNPYNLFDISVSDVKSITYMSLSKDYEVHTFNADEIQNAVKLLNDFKYKNRKVRKPASGFTYVMTVNLKNEGKQTLKIEPSENCIIFNNEVYYGDCSDIMAMIS